MNKDSRVFIAGGSGLVGRAIVKNLKDRGFSNLIYPTHKELDLLDGVAVSDFYASEKPEYVIAAAARVGGINANSTYPADFLRENLVMQDNVIWNAHIACVKNIGTGEDISIRDLASLIKK
jgi:GDP-L-fucose synthase